MLTASPITRQTVGRTFTVAISILGVGAVLQLGVIGWAFATRPANPVPSFVSIANTPGTEFGPNATANPPSQPDLTRNPFDEPPAQITTNPIAVVPPKPTPVPQSTPTPEPMNRFEEAMLQGRTLRDRGDVSAALTKFREAAAMDPKSPAVYGELAGTYEKMGSMDRAAENWRKIYDMGPSAGIYYNLAETKLKVQQAMEINRVVAQAGPDLSQPLEGFTPGATLGLGDIRVEDQPDDASAKRFILHIPIKARPQTKMAVNDLVIHVLFYDIVDGQSVVQTSANVSSRWMSPPADWTEGDSEELAVEYHLPKPEAKAAKKENRKYFGYLVRIYYKQQLQSSAAEPERLAQQYPPPPTLPKDPDK
jgi:hypothetical protein